MTTLNLLDDNLSLSLEQGEICLWQLDYDQNVIKVWDTNNMMLLFAHDGNSFSMTVYEFFTEYCNPEEVRQIKLRLELAFVNDTPFHMEHQIYNRKHHCWLWVYSFGITRLMADGHKRFYGGMHNIDNRKRYGFTLGREPDLAECIKPILDAMPLACTFWGEEGKPLDCNLEALRLFRLNDKQQYIDEFFKLSPEIQPDGSNSRQAIEEGLVLVRKTGFERFEWMHQTIDGQPIPSEITLVSVKRPNGNMTIGYTRDLREAKHLLSPK